jgi:predicted nucleic acid-binding protein
MILSDTNIIIEFYKNNPAVIEELVYVFTRITTRKTSRNFRFG